MTLAFSLPAVRQLAHPAAAFEDARAWSQAVGIVDNDVEAIETFVATHELPQDYEVGDADKWLALERIRAETPTPRHVYVGGTDEDRRVASRLGWEFVPVAEAADKAGWNLDETDDGVLSRLLRTLTGDR